MSKNINFEEIDIGLQFRNFVSQVISVIATAACVYCLGSTLVRLSSDKTRLIALNSADFELLLSEHINWVKFNKKTNELDAVSDPPRRRIQNIFQLSEKPAIPQLQGVTHSPLIDCAGKLICQQPGYDPEYGYFALFDKADFAPYCWSKEPTVEEGQAAIAELADDLLGDFAFLTPQDKSVALSALVTASLRPVLKAAPMFLNNAPFGTGKSLLSDVLGIFAAGRIPAASSWPSNEDDCRKLLISKLISFPPVVFFDNANGLLRPHNCLCTCLTEPVYEDRILGKSEVAAVSTKSLFLVNGKNARVTEDLERRTLPIYMSARSRLNRSFKHADLRSYVLKERTRLIMLALKGAAAYVRANTPVKGVTPVLNYDDWDLLCRRTLLFYGYADPAVPILEALTNKLTEDPDQKLADLLVELIGLRTPFGTAEVSDLLASEHATALMQLLPPHVMDPSGNVNRRVLGHVLSAWCEEADLYGLAVTCTGTAPQCKYVLHRLDEQSADTAGM